MPDRKYIYKVEIDASQAKKQAEELRRTLERELNGADSGAQAAQLRQATATMQAEQRRQTQAFRTESQMRVALVRAEANVAVQESKAAAAARIEQEKRITSEYRAEIRRREREERLARTAPLAATRPTLGGAWRGMDMMAGMAVGGLGALGVVQAASSAYDSAQQGAVLQRQQATFTEFAARMNQDANAIIAAVRRASNATMTEFDAMGLASQVLASKFAEGRDDIAGDLETVTAFSRRASQIYVDKQTGQALNVQEVFSRMVGYAREGNKELVDQFNVTNAGIADALGVPVEAFGGPDGAALRWQGLIKVLTSELDRLGPAAETAADRFEQSAARIEDARQRIQMAMAGPGAAVAEAGAGIVEGAMTFVGASPLDTLIPQVNQRRNAAPGNFLADSTAAYDAGIAAAKAYGAAIKENAAAADLYSGRLQVLLSNLINQGTLTDDATAELENMKRALDLVARGTDAYTAAQSQVTDEALRENEALFTVYMQMTQLEQEYITGAISGAQYSAGINVLTKELGSLAGVAGIVGPLLEGVTRAMGGATSARAAFLNPENLWGAPAGMTDRQVAAMYELNQWRQQQADKRAAEAIANEPYTAAGQDKLRQNLVLDLQKQAAADERATARAAQGEWESAAKKTAAEFEAAAEKAAAAFEGALRRVPGLFDSSSVTGEQMAGAAAGIPQNFADNYLRRLADEVGGGRDWEGIDIRDAAMRAGVDPGLPPELILQQVRGAWDDSSLFAGGRNLDLITQFGGLEAIQANIARQEAAASGEQALLGLLNKEGEAGAVTAENAPATAAAMVAAVEAAFSEENVTSSLKAVGDSAITAIHAGYTSTAGRLNWAGPLVDAVAAQVLDSLNNALNQP